MGRRANNEGTICQRKDGRWCAAITMPNGKRKWFYGKEQRDVLSKLTEARSLLQRNMLPEPSRITFGQWLDSFFTTDCFCVMSPDINANHLCTSSYYLYYVYSVPSVHVLGKMWEKNKAPISEGLPTISYPLLERVLRGG